MKKKEKEEMRHWGGGRRVHGCCSFGGRTTGWLCLLFGSRLGNRQLNDRGSISIFSVVLGGKVA